MSSLVYVFAVKLRAIEIAYRELVYYQEPLHHTDEPFSLTARDADTSETTQRCTLE